MAQSTESPLRVKPVIPPKPLSHQPSSSSSSFAELRASVDRQFAQFNNSTPVKKPFSASGSLPFGSPSFGALPSGSLSAGSLSTGSLSSGSLSSQKTGKLQSVCNTKTSVSSPKKDPPVSEKFEAEITRALKEGPFKKSSSLIEARFQINKESENPPVVNRIQDTEKALNTVNTKDLDPLEALMKLVGDSLEMPLVDFTSWPIDELHHLLSVYGNIEQARIHFIFEWNDKVNHLLESSGFSTTSLLYRNVVSLVLSQLGSDVTSALNCLTNDNARALIATYESMLEQDLNCYQMDPKEDAVSQMNDLGINPRLWREATVNVIQAAQTMQHQHQRCKICFEEFLPSDIFGLSCCQCIICNTCMRSFFSLNIRDGHVANFVCPVCRCPDIDDDTMHFQLLEPKLKFLLSKEDFVAYQQKMTEWNLMKNQNFRWCINTACRFGFLIPDSGQCRVICPECKTEMCSQCKKPWETQHEGLSCEEFSEWKRNNDSRFQEEGLAHQLQENGIDCPRCRRRYWLSRGGCIHFTCTYCYYEFCSACLRPFVRTCKKLASCQQSGLHCHHPRNCLYYLRDKSVQELQKLLEENGSEYDNRSRIGVNFCSVVEEKDVDGIFKQEACKKSVSPGQAGLCEIHYKEYLAGVVVKDGIDPVAIMNENELIREIQNADVTDGCPNKIAKETSEQYRDRLIRIVLDRIPLRIFSDNSRLH